MYCCSVRDMWRTTDNRRMGWESQAELNLLIWNQQENERPAVGGKPRQSAPIPPVEMESAVTPFTVAREGRKRQPYPLSLMSNSTKAGEVETRCGLKVRGDVMDTRLMNWWTGIAEPIEASPQVVDCNKLKVRFSCFAGDPDEVTAPLLGPFETGAKQAVLFTRHMRGSPKHKNFLNSACVIAWEESFSKIRVTGRCNGWFGASSMC